MPQSYGPVQSLRVTRHHTGPESFAPRIVNRLGDQEKRGHMLAVVTSEDSRERFHVVIAQCHGRARDLLLIGFVLPWNIPVTMSDLTQYPQKSELRPDILAVFSSYEIVVSRNVKHARPTAVVSGALIQIRQNGAFLISHMAFRGVGGCGWRIVRSSRLRPAGSGAQ